MKGKDADGIRGSYWKRWNNYMTVEQVSWHIPWSKQKEDVCDTNSPIPGFQWRQFSCIFISVLWLRWSLGPRCFSTGSSGSYSDRRIEKAGLEVALYNCIREMLHSNLCHHIWYPDWGSCGFRQSLQTNSRFVPVLRLDQLLPYPSQFIIHLPPYRVMLYGPDTENALLNNPRK
jgi:hypothetical protein